MRKARFVIGIIFFIIAVVAFVLGTIMFADSLKSLNVEENDASVIALIITLPFTLIAYAAELLAVIVAIILFCPYRKDYEEEGVRKASIIMTVICIVMIVASIAAIACLFIGGSSGNTEDVTNILIKI